MKSFTIKLWKEFIIHRIQRGNFLMKTVKKLVSLALATVVAASLFVGCNKKTDPVSTTPKGPKELKLYLYNAGNLDPYFYNWGGLTLRMGAFETLTKLDANNKAVPGQAEKWEHNADYTVWKFTLKKGLKWSDGTALTAKDFEYSIKRTVDVKTFPGKPSSYNVNVPIKDAPAAKAGKADPNTIGVKALDDTTLEFTLEKPSSILPESLSELWACPVPKHVIDKVGQTDWTKVENIVTNGPFKVTAWELNTKVEMVPNTNYYGKANWDKIVVMSGDTNQLLAYKNGDINIANLTNTDMEAVLKDPELKKEMQIFKGATVYHMKLLRGKNDILQTNQKVRQAIAMSLDKKTIANDIMKGSVRESNSMVPEIFAPWGNEIGLKYDVAKAKQLMAEAGFPEGKGFPEMTILISGTPTGRELAIKDMIEKGTGIKCKILNEEYAQFSKDEGKFWEDGTIGFSINGRGTQYPSYIGYMEMPNFDDSLLNVALATMPQAQYAGFKAIQDDTKLEPNEKVKKKEEYIRQNATADGKKYLDMLDKAKAENDPAKKEALYKEAAKFREDQAIAINIDWENGVKLVKSNIKGYAANPLLLGTPPYYFNDMKME